MTNTVNGAAVQQPTIKKKSRAGEIWRRFRKNKLAVFGMILFALILLVAIFADAIVNYSVATTQVAADRLLSPNAEHWFGTDNSAATFSPVSSTAPAIHCWWASAP